MREDIGLGRVEHSVYGQSIMKSSLNKCLLSVAFYLLITHGKSVWVQFDTQLLLAPTTCMKHL